MGGNFYIGFYPIIPTKVLQRNVKVIIKEHLCLSFQTVNILFLLFIHWDLLTSTEQSLLQ